MMAEMRSNVEWAESSGVGARGAALSDRLATGIAPWRASSSGIYSLASTIDSCFENTDSGIWFIYPRAVAISSNSTLL